MYRDDEKWEKIFNCAKDYYEEHGNLNVPKDYLTDENTSLSTWLTHQKQLFTIGKLYEDRIEKLKEIGFNFNAQRVRLSWAETFDLLIDYYNDNGNIDLKKNYKAENGTNLYAWLRTQKRAYNEGQLDEEKKLKLELLGFKFENILEAKWNEHYLEAKEYYEATGCLDIIADYTLKDGSNLKRWIYSQINMYRKGKLSQYKADKLRDLGIKIDNNKRFNLPWEEVYKIAEEYYKEHGNFNVPRYYVTKEGCSLGKWLNTQKNNYGKGKLSNERKELLEKIGVSFDKVGTRKDWEEAYKIAEEYYKEYGNLNVISSYVTKDGYKLGVWLDSQREKFKKGLLSEDNVKRLQSIGMNFEKKDTIWLRMYKCLLQYYLDNGNIYVPYEYVTKDGYPLGKWVTKQKKLYLSGKLRSNQKQKLDEINFTVILDNEVEIKDIVDDQNNKQKISIYLIRLCLRLKINVDKNYEFISKLSYEDFKTRLIILRDTNERYCDENGLLHPIFNMTNEDIINTTGYVKPNSILRLKLIKNSKNIN